MLQLSKHFFFFNEGVLAIQHIYKNLRPFTSKWRIPKTSYSNKNSYSKTLFWLLTNTCMPAPVIDSKPPYKVLISIAELGCRQAVAHFLDCRMYHTWPKQQAAIALQASAAVQAESCDWHQLQQQCWAWQPGGKGTVTCLPSSAKLAFSSRNW